MIGFPTGQGRSVRSRVGAAELWGRGVRFVEGPRETGCGTVGVFADLYGNRWDLVQYRDAASVASGSAAG